MAKFGMNPAFEFLSGKLGKYLVAEKVKHVLKVGGLSTTGVFRRLGDHASYGQILQNVREAWKIAATAWGTLTTTEKQTWNDQADSLINQGYVVKSGFQLFMSECISIYGSQYGSGVFPTGLTNGGSSWEYINRASFTWAA
jgi:hypothetical protein